MKQLLRYLIGVLSFIAIGAGLSPVTAQVFNPNDPVVTYNPSAPPTKPAAGQVGKWVRSVKVSFSTSSYKAYIYNNLPFRLKYPKNYNPANVYPIMVFFHGIGEFGESIYDNEYQLYLGGQRHANAVDNGTFNGFLLYPQNESPNWSDGDVSNIMNLIHTIMVPQLNVDPFRIFVNGLSAGGNTTWGALRNHTKSVAAITPISSAYQSYADDLQKFKYTPIYHFQGALDGSPTPITSRKLGNTILNGGGNYRYREFANQGHSCWNVAWADGDYFPFYNKAHKANPWPAFGKTEFCVGEVINTTIGVTAGFEGYEWRKNGVVIPGANGNELTVTGTGTYDCRILRGTRWSPWSPTPVVIKLKSTVSQPTIKVVGLASRHIPAPDGSTTVPLEVNGGYATYNWQKEGSAAVLSTTRLFTATEIGNYKMQVTDKFTCQKTTFKIDAEDYFGMVGVVQEITSDLGPGLKVSSIDLNDYMDYTVDVPVAASYTFTARIASKVSGAQFQVKDAGGNIYATVDVPNTGGEEEWKEVSAIVTLPAGLQTIRLQSTAAAKWDINYFQITGSNTGNFTSLFSVIDANGINPPEPITNLVTSILSQTSVQLTWSQTANPAYNETGFEVYQAENVAGPYKLVAITAANATGAAISNLNPGTEYFYKVRAINNTAASAVSQPNSVVTQADVTPPTAPLELRLGTISKSSIRLYWNRATDNIGVVKYDVYVNGAKASVTSALDMYVYHLLPNTTYTFTVKARDLGGNSSPFSNAVTAKTKTGTNALDPSMVPANPADHSVYLNFNLENPAAAPWNNMNVLPSAGDVTDNLKNYAGNNTGIKMTIVDNFSGYNAGGMNTGNNSGVYPDNVIRSAYYNDQGNVAKLRVDGLSLRHKYSFVFFGSRNGGGDRTTIYKINNKSVSLNASFNISTTVQIDDVIPDINGSVTIEVSLGANSQFAYMNSLVMKGYSLGDVPVTNNSPTVNAGPDQTIALPTRTVLMNGSASDEDGTIASYRWSKTAGPATFTISNDAAANPTISNLVEGTYIFRLTATDDDGAATYDDVEVVVAPMPPPPGTRFVKVNLYGGANPYGNAEWNNWNVVSSLSSGALKFSDASTSSISAVLSQSNGITDNGATYGGTMCPPEVLRYTTSSSVTRTLTLSGLDPSKTYSLELYASRGNTGNSTVFTAGGTSVTIATSSNKTAAATFSSLVPNASGSLVVTIAKVNSYNYLNGFVLTELGTYPGAPTASAGADQSISLPASATLSGSASDPDGSIASYAWTRTSGPAATINSPSSASTTVSNLSVGTYTFRLTVTDNDGLSAFDDVEVVVAPAPPPPGTKYVKVNLFGGTNPYNNSEWNNWNVVSSLSSGALKYSDASLSSIGAALSQSNGVTDNGSSYGGTMCPPEVLRYTTSSGVTRTLTLSGLNPAKIYNLELYASRGNTGNSTLFTAGGSSVTIATSSNKTAAASFSSLVPDASGNLVVTIASVNTYNYLNGLMLTELGDGSLNTTTVVSAGINSEAVASSVADQAVSAGKLSVRVLPNPSRHVFTLVVGSSSTTGEGVNLRVFDAGGRVVEQRTKIASGSSITLGAGYQTGTYYAELTQGNQRTTTKLMKIN